MTSLTGGGGLSASGGDATSGNGDQTVTGSQFGGINFGGGGSSQLTSLGLVALAALALYLALKK
ncbi:hypothetical protein [Ferrimonas balearica]|uniref:hypothetical protein n=1 Tax=Ferrimonas balearica TaxID=44012 RepID=UPI001F3ACEA5|nr:hypothetical protein [Ferrimonas balearica]MBY6095128.1 hypothetical protein [Ferrimonas balearica]